MAHMPGIPDLGMSAGNVCKHFANKLLSTPQHKTVYPDTKCSPPSDMTTPPAIWEHEAAHWACFF
jgi:hypothetical protein